MARRGTRPRFANINIPPRAPDPKGEWMQDGHRDAFRIQFGSLEISVHRYVGYPPETWLMTCHEVRIGPRELASVDIEAAKAEAIGVVRAVVNEWAVALARLDPKEIDQ